MTAEIERIISNLVRIGVVSELDEANARVKMKVGGLSTDWLPWGVSRAGATRTWSAPREGDQHMVFSPYGDPAQAVVGPAIYQDDHPAPASSKDQEHVLYPDGSTVDYNSATNTLTVTVASGGNVVINCKHATINAADDATVNTKTATVNASTKVDLLTPTTHCSGNLLVDGNAAITGALSYGGGLTGQGGSGANLTGPLNVNGAVSNTGTLSSNGKNVGSTHTHAGVQPGGGTSGAPS